MRNVSGQNGKVPRLCPKGRQFLMYMLGSGKGWGGVLISLQEELPSTKWPLWYSRGHMKNHQFAAWLGGQSVTRAVSTCYFRFCNKVHARGWVVIFLSSDVLVKVAGLCGPPKRVKYSFFTVLWKRLWTIGIISSLNVCEVAWAWDFHWSKHLLEIVAWHFT